jgi:hypothetical protein
LDELRDLDVIVEKKTLSDIKKSRRPRSLAG